VGKADGTFSVQSLPGYVVDQVADVNIDGKPDLLVTYFGGSSHPLHTGVLLGNGDGSFGSLIAVRRTGTLPLGFVVADMNNDGQPDIVFPFAGNVNGAAVMINNTSPSFQISASALSPSTIAPVVLLPLRSM
jgi:hypothetical protein